jgi:iron uptake system EfeUOB component EfeO/EfeM
MGDTFLQLVRSDCRERASQTGERKMSKYRQVEWEKLESNFKTAITPLADYRRGAAFEYVNALKERIKEQQKQIDEIAEQFIALQERCGEND